ncbi:MAG: hypothetical protein ACO2PO_15580 [Candidatus Calescibacterium sp.]
MRYYYDEDLEDLEKWEEWEDLEEWEEEFSDEENGVVEYMYGLDEKTLRNKLAPDPRENPSQFSKIGVYKLQNLANQYKYLIIELGNEVKPNAKLFYTVRFWWVDAGRSVKRLVDWAIYGPTSSHYIAIPVDDIVGIYRLKGYHMSSDIFIEFRVDEEVSRFGWKVLERRFGLAKFVKENIKDENKEAYSDDFKKKQENKPSKPSGTKPKKQTNNPQKPESKPKKDEKDEKDENIPVFIQPVQPTMQRTPIMWIIIGLGIVGALMFWLKIKNRK